MKITDHMLRVGAGLALGIALSGTAFGQSSNGPLALRTDSVATVTNEKPEPAPVIREQLTLKQAVALALGHSTGVSIAQADQKIAERNLAQQKYAFLPQIVVGSGLG